jgi:hypothetical protein
MIVRSGDKREEILVNGICGSGQYEMDQKFLESKQEPLRLKIALERFFETEVPEWKERYGNYLKSRIRPSMERLIAAGDLDKIEVLAEYADLSERNLNDFIEIAMQQKQAEIVVYLLKRKRERYGFSDRDFSL